jgi:L-2-hydroxyglutarate oxidase LhgO
VTRATSIVVGAGVVGLAVARALARRGDDVVVIEAEPTFGMHQSSRNSEVIHAGIYYPPGSLKARTCLEGKARLYAWCRERGVEHRAVGKLIVATDQAEVATLERLLANARRCGLEAIELVDAARCRELEPQVRAVAGLWSPTTGIVDSHGYMRSLLRDAEDAGAMVAWRTPFEGARLRGGALEVHAGGTSIRGHRLINAAGPGAQAVAARIDGVGIVPALHLAKGSYFRLARRSPFTHLVYPVPAAASLGVHVTIDLAGVARFGPDEEWTSQLDYAVDPRRGDPLYTAIRRWWPELPDGALEPDYAGVRAKVQAPGDPMRDFVVHGPVEHGIPGLVNLFGIESPGLTASLALAEVVVDAVR